MLRVLVTATVLIGVGWACSPAQAADPIAQLLPPGSRVLQERPVPPSTRVIAVAYRDGKDYVGLAQVEGATAKWIRRFSLPTGFVRFAPRTPTSFVVTVIRGSIPGAMGICAFVVGLHSASPAISAADSCVEGDEGVRLHPDGFTLWTFETGHRGSVRYRLLVRYRVRAGLFRVVSQNRVPDYPSNAMPVPSATVRTASHNIDLLRLEVAQTEQERDTGLMNRKALDPDSGMIFAWPGSTRGTYSQVHDSFWMDNTYIPLSIAFLSSTGTVQELDDMQPLTTDLHTPVEPYTFAIEANIGYFADNGIRVGDRFLIRWSTPSS